MELIVFNLNQHFLIWVEFIEDKASFHKLKIIIRKQLQYKLNFLELIVFNFQLHIQI